MVLGENFPWDLYSWYLSDAPSKSFGNALHVSNQCLVADGFVLKVQLEFHIIVLATPKALTCRMLKRVAQQGRSK